MTGAANDTTTTSNDVAEDLAARITLMTLPKVGPARARWLLSGDGPAGAVIDDLRSGRLPAGVGPAPPRVTRKLVKEWAAALRRTEPAQLLADASRVAAHLLHPDHPLWPFADDPDPPVVVFATANLSLVARRPLVAMVGTRRCTALGRRVAFDLAAELARAGVGIVSGLAIGIDAAAHQGALSAGGWVVGVVATGLDVVYPRSNANLWSTVAADGLLLSEAPPGSAPERWRFPARNRLIAALAEVVVVVESHAEGGSLLTAGEAADRGRPVMAVPGSITSPASAGSNRLLVDGCGPVCSAADILDLLGQTPQPSLPFGAAEPSSGPTAQTANESALARTILTQVGAGACHIDELVATCRATIPELLAEINRLHGLGMVALDGSTVSIGRRYHHP